MAGIFDGMANRPGLGLGGSGFFLSKRTLASLLNALLLPLVLAALALGLIINF